jgi:CelD/BcsL family acetyltransferase involved in cellulose biosynthesis
VTQAPTRGAAPRRLPAGPAAAETPEDQVAVEVTPLSTRLREDWDDLAQRVGASPFLRPGYLDAWTGGFGAPKGLRAITARSAGRLEGLACIAVRGGRLRSIGNYDTPRVGIVASCDEARAAVARALVAHGTHRLTMAPLPEGGRSHSAIAAAADAAGHPVLSRTVIRCPVVDTSGDWDVYWRSRSRNTRHKVERLLRRLDEAGDAEFGIHSGEDGLDALLEEGLRVEASGWKGAAGSAVASRPESLRYYAELARWAAEHGWLRLGFLRLNGRAMAFGYAVEANGVHSLLKIGFDPRLARLSPGTLLLHRMIRHAFDAGCAEFDFAGQAEPYKLAWATGEVEYVEVQAFRPSARGRLGLTAARARGALVASPAAPPLRRARTALGSASRRLRPGARIVGLTGREKTMGTGGR